MATNQTLIPPPPQQDEELHLLPTTTMDESLWSSLRNNIKAALFPEKLPPLQLTSRPVKVREIWGQDSYKKESAGVSLVVHIAMIGGLIAVSIVGAKVVTEKPKETVTLIAPDLTPPQLPMTKKSATTSGGGGGGGDHDKLQAPKGKLPKTAMEQITPPAVVIRNDNPKLPVEPTVVIPPQIKLSS
ncbi:MAG TPA: energy transducer TonB, partial [Verrucomicrobiae bacterium]|nr:energy transducer TonB [Verrucomicrobiae bacterium]